MYDLCAKFHGLSCWLRNRVDPMPTKNSRQFLAKPWPTDTVKQEVDSIICVVHHIENSKDISVIIHFIGVKFSQPHFRDNEVYSDGRGGDEENKRDC